VDPVVRKTYQPPTPAPASHSEAGFPERYTESVFVGRDREMRELDAGLADALSGRGRLFLIGGEPGIGKSRLADELASHARERGAQVLWGRCWEAGGAPAYWPWVQSIRSYVRDAEPEVLTSQLGSRASDIAQMIPEVRELYPELPAPPSLDPEGARFRLFDSTTAFLRHAATARPLVLVLDDLQAADTPSLLLLQFVAGELAEAHIMVVGAYRDEGLDQDRQLASILAELSRGQVTRHLQLTGLDESEVARFIETTASISAPDALVSAVYRETEGNPLFMMELIRLLAAEGHLGLAEETAPFRITIPPRVREVIGHRLGRLSERCISVLTLASVLGREFGLNVLERKSGRSGDELLEVLDEAVVARVVIEVPAALGRLRFSHALIRDALYEALTPRRRVQLHREIGEALEVLYAEDTGPHLAELAHHFCEAAPGGGVDKAVDYAWRAADRAAALTAYEEAVRLYQLALQALGLSETAEESTRCELLLALGDAQTRAGDTPAAQETFLQAADIARRLEMPERLARAALGYGGRFAWTRAGSDPKLVPLLEDSLAALKGEESTLRARLLARLAGALRDQPTREPRASLSRDAVDMARKLDDPATLAYALEARSEAIWWLENTMERLAIATELLRLSEGIRDRERAFESHIHRLIAFLELGDMVAADAELGASARLAEELRQPAQLWHVVVARASRALFDGRLGKAEELIRQALSIGERAQVDDALVAFRVQTLLLGKEQGRLEELETVKVWVEEHPARPMFRCLLAHVSTELGRRDEARMAFEALAANNFADVPLDNEWLFAMTHLPEVCSFLGDTRRAGTLYELLLPYAERNAVNVPEGGTGSVSRGLGILAATMEHWEEGARHFEAALEMNARMGARPWVAHTHQEYARMLLARDGLGDQERAVELLVGALETCRELGMVALEGKVSALLEGREASAMRTSGAPVPSSPRDLGPSVFRREGEYWSMAYEGDAFRLKNSKGLGYIAHLLRDPGREFHVMDLVRAGEGAEADAPVWRRPGRRHTEPGLHVTDEDAGSILDPQAKAAYRRRLAELEEELEEAKVWDDPERAARAKEEGDFLTRELAGAMGLGGRDRKAASAAEHARINVTKAIKSALTRIRKNSPALGLHLDRTIRTGAFCSYIPDPRFPIPWQL